VVMMWDILDVIVHSTAWASSIFTARRVMLGVQNTVEGDFFLYIFLSKKRLSARLVIACVALLVLEMIPTQVVFF
jgi:hypothetical protein